MVSKVSAKHDRRNVYTGTIQLNCIGDHPNVASYMTRSSFDICEDENAMVAALEFKSAAKREGKALIQWIAPRWIARILYGFKIRARIWFV